MRPATARARGRSRSGSSSARDEPWLLVAQGAGRGQLLAGLQQRLEATENHRPAAVQLGVRALAQVAVDDDEPARVADRLDLPGDRRGPLALDVLAPERVKLWTRRRGG